MCPHNVHSLLHLGIQSSRELVCECCGLNNRIRAVYQYLVEVVLDNNKSKNKMFLPEHRTPLYGILKTSQPNLDIRSSEFFGEKVERGKVGSLGIRNEDLTQLTYQNGEFDIAVCLEVLEHVPDYREALCEIYRVLKENGTAIITVPFLWDKYETLVRAKIDNDSIVHIREPEYHGDPNSDNPCLCFYHFGWDILDKMKSVGFADINAILYWSVEYGYLGNYQFMFTAKK